MHTILWITMYYGDFVISLCLLRISCEEDHRETVFLLSGSDEKVHLFREVSKVSINMQILTFYIYCSLNGKQNFHACNSIGCVFYVANCNIVKINFCSLHFIQGPEC